MSRGRIAHANAVGCELLARDQDMFRARVVQASVAGAPGWTPAVTVTAAGLPAYRLVIRDLPAAPRFETAARQWRLTARQTEVLRHLADGHANKTIAALLDCATHTVELHVTEILRRAEADSRAALVAKMWKHYGR
jgi:DNA-binding NarL/FixJ family response regulator